MSLSTSGLLQKPTHHSLYLDVETTLSSLLSCTGQGNRSASRSVPQFQVQSIAISTPINSSPSSQGTSPHRKTSSEPSKDYKSELNVIPDINMTDDILEVASKLLQPKFLSVLPHTHASRLSPTICWLEDPTPQPQYIAVEERGFGLENLLCSTGVHDGTTSPG
jgi:hypothetical protein